VKLFVVLCALQCFPALGSRSLASQPSLDNVTVQFGDPEAPNKVTLIISLTCSHCGECLSLLRPSLEKAIQQKKIFFTLIFYIDNRGSAEAALLIMHCARVTGKSVLDLLTTFFERLPEWLASKQPNVFLTETIVSQLGGGRPPDALQEDELQRLVSNNKRVMENLDVNMIPAVRINFSKFTQGKCNHDEIDRFTQ
jgi:hypothetical protein